jgi:hypothetical protein
MSGAEYRREIELCRREIAEIGLASRLLAERLEALVERKREAAAN